MGVPLTKSETAGETVMSSSAQSPPATAGHMIRLAARDDGICVLTFDRPNSSANVFDVRTLAELADELDFIERQTKIKGVIFISAKPSIFIAGLDLNLLRESTSPAEVRALIERGQAVM